MKTLLLVFSIAVLASCGTSGPVTANPDRGTTTDGTAGSAKITDGAPKEGMNRSQTTIGADSVQAKRDSLRRQ